MNVRRFTCAVFLLLSPTLGGCAYRRASTPPLYYGQDAHAVQRWTSVLGYRPVAPTFQPGTTRMQVPRGCAGGTIVKETRPAPNHPRSPTPDAWIYETPPPEQTRREALQIAALGLVFFRDAHYERSLVFWTRALELLPDHQCILTYHAACLVRLGRRTEAKAEFQKAISLDPSSADADQARKWIDKLSR